MLLVILSPLLYLLINKSKGTVLALLSLLWIGFFNLNLFVSSEALLFFSVGLFLAQIKSIILPSKKVTWILCIFYLILSLLETHSLSTQNSMPPLHEFNILLGCVEIFSFSTNINGAGRIAALLRTLAASFFFCLRGARKSTPDIQKDPLRRIIPSRRYIVYWYLFFCSSGNYCFTGCGILWCAAVSANGNTASAARK